MHVMLHTCRALSWHACVRTCMAPDFYPILTHASSARFASRPLFVCRILTIRYTRFRHILRMAPNFNYTGMFQPSKIRLKVVARKRNMEDSDVASAVFTVIPPYVPPHTAGTQSSRSQATNAQPAAQTKDPVSAATGASSAQRSGASSSRGQTKTTSPPSNPTSSKQESPKTSGASHTARSHETAASGDGSGPAKAPPDTKAPWEHVRKASGSGDVTPGADAQPRGTHNPEQHAAMLNQRGDGASGPAERAQTAHVHGYAGAAPRLGEESVAGHVHHSHTEDIAGRAAKGEDSSRGAQHGGMHKSTAPDGPQGEVSMCVDRKSVV